MVTATDCWSASVLGFSVTAACVTQFTLRAAATAALSFLTCMGFSSFLTWYCLKRGAVPKGLHRAAGRSNRLLPPTTQRRQSMALIRNIGAPVSIAAGATHYWEYWFGA